MRTKSCRLTRLTLGLALAASSTALAASSTALAAAPSRELSFTGGATGIEQIVLVGGKGEVHVVAIPEDEVRVHVKVEPHLWSDTEIWRRVAHWFVTSAYEEDADLMRAVRLVTDRDGGRLELTIEPGGRTRTNRTAETWIVEAPARLALRVELDSGDIGVQGIGGGVTLRLGAGDADVRATAGDLDLRVGVGDLAATLESGSLGNVKLESDVGDTRLWMRGARIEQPREPGPGNHIALRGQGQFSVHATVDVGDVEVHLP